MEVDPLAWLIFLISVVTVWFAVAIELALTITNRSEIRGMGENGERRAAAAERLLQEPDRLLITSMLLKTIGLVTAGAAVMRMLPSAPSYIEILMIVFVTWILLALVRVLGRAAAVRWTMAIALPGAVIMRVIYVALWPIYALLRQVGVWLGTNGIDEVDENVFMSEEAIRLLIDVGDEEPILDSEKQMITSILEMDETVAREVMVPRIDVVALDVNTTMRDALDVVIDAGHSRLPVYEDNIDQIVGFLYAKDLLQCFKENRDDMPIDTLLRPVNFVPETKKVNALLAEMQRRRVHVSIIVDEYGGTAGLVTIEDILEEIVGEIQDEYDEEEELFVESLDVGHYVINSRYDLYSLSKLLDIDLSDEEADTLGGLLYSELGHVPEQGESVEVDGWRFTILSLEGRRIEQVRAELVSAPEYVSANVVEEGAGESRALNFSLSD